MKHYEILNGDALEMLKTLPDETVDCCVTSPPYYALRDYGVDGQIGLEDTPEAYIERLVDVFREVKRVLKNDGTLWVNIADSYWGSGKGQSNSGAMPKSEIQLSNRGSVLGKRPKFAGGVLQAKRFDRRAVAPRVCLAC